MRHPLPSIFVLAAICIFSSFQVHAADTQTPAPTAKEELQQTLQSAPGDLKKPEVNPYANIPQKFIAEAHQFNITCDASPTMNRFYNCKCLATKYLDKRIDLGPDADHNSIILAISKECIDAAGAAGYEYDQCMSNSAMMPYQIPAEQYCSCYAKTYAKLFENMHVSPDTETSIELQTQAYTTCENPELAKQLYPQVIPSKQR